MPRDCLRMNWICLYTTRDLRNTFPDVVLTILPFNTRIGLKPDRTNAGYKPERKTPIQYRPNNPSQKSPLRNKEKERSCPDNALNPGMLTKTIIIDSITAAAFSKADSDRN